jgi:Domain of unknown function (DUF2382)
VKFDDGTSLPVAPDALVHQAEGSYRLTKSAGSIGAVDQSNAVVIPVVAEELTVEKEQIVRGKVRMHKRVETREEVANTPSSAKRSGMMNSLRFQAIERRGSIPIFYHVEKTRITRGMGHLGGDGGSLADH